MLDVRAARGRDRPADSLPLRLRVFARRGTLDRLLADGIDPATDPRLALRAAQLARPALRARLACQLREAVRSIDGRALTRRRRPQVPVDVTSVRACLAEIEDLARSLTDIAPRVRGIAIACRLLTDGLSPLYQPGRQDQLRRTLRTARAAL